MRAFTHGYDLFEPSQVVVWHEYVRAASPKHWDDHPGGAEPAWHDRDEISRTKMRRMFEGGDAGPFGLGSARTLAEYEAFAGVSFRHRKVQDYTRQNLQPPNPAADPDWPLRFGDFHLEIPLDDRLSSEVLDDVDFWHLAVHDEQARDLYTGQIRHARLVGFAKRVADGEPVTLADDFEAQAQPHTWSATPYTTGGAWLSPIRGEVDEAQRGSLEARRPIRAPGITWESSGDVHVANVPGDTPRRHELNSSGVLLVELADGDHSVREVADYLVHANQLDDDPLPGLLAFYRNASSAGLVTIGGVGA